MKILNNILDFDAEEIFKDEKNQDSSDQCDILVESQHESDSVNETMLNVI